jgi:predicted ATPase
VTGARPFVDLADGLRTLGFYNFQPEAMRPLQNRLLGARLEKDGRNLASVIGTLKGLDPDSLERVRDYLSAITEEIDGFDAIRYGDYETVRFRLRTGSAGPAPEFDAAGMSDGTLRALAALVAAFQVQVRWWMRWTSPPSGPRCC